MSPFFFMSYRPIHINPYVSISNLRKECNEAWRSVFSRNVLADGHHVPLQTLAQQGAECVCAALYALNGKIYIQVVKNLSLFSRYCIISSIQFYSYVFNFIFIIIFINILLNIFRYNSCYNIFQKQPL